MQDLNDLKRGLDDSLKKWYSWRHADTSNLDWASTLSKKTNNYREVIPPCISLLLHN